MFITATPNSELKKELQSIIRKSPFKIRVIEKAGTKLVRHLQRNDPFKRNICNDKKKCMVCKYSEAGACRETGVSYKIECTNMSQDKCPYEYIGQTGKNAYTRGIQHLEDFEQKRDSSILWRHCQNVHAGEIQKFTMKIMDRCRNDPTKRRILEAIRIQKIPHDRIMNGKGEWNTARVPRVSIITESIT